MQPAAPILPKDFADRCAPAAWGEVRQLRGAEQPLKNERRPSHLGSVGNVGLAAGVELPSDSKSALRSSDLDRREARTNPKHEVADLIETYTDSPAALAIAAWLRAG